MNPHAQVTRPGQMTAVMRTFAVPQGPRIPRVAVVRGGRIVDEYLVREGSSVTIGTSEQARIVVPGDGLPASFELLERVGERYFLRFLEGMTGRVSTASGVTRLEELRGAAHATQDGAWRVPLQEDARGKVVIGDTTFLFQIVPRPPLAPRPQLPISVIKGIGLDWGLTIIAAFSFLLHFGIAGAMYSDWMDPIVAADHSVNGIVDVLPYLPKPAPEPTTTPSDPSAPAPSTPTTTTTPTARNSNTTSNNTSTPRNTHPTPQTASDAQAARLAAQADQMEIGLLSLKDRRSSLADTLDRTNTPAVDISSAAEKAIGATHENRDLHVATGGPLAANKSSSLVGLVGDNTQRSTVSTAGTQSTSFAPVIATPPAMIPGGAAISDADAVIAKLRPRFRRCYQDGLLSNPSMSGKVVIAAKVAPNGEVSSVDIASNEGLSQATAACISNVIAKAEFKGNGTITTIKIPVSVALQK